MRETAFPLEPADLGELRKRARQVREEAVRLSSDYHFILAWYQMRPRPGVRSAPILEE